MSKEDIWGRWLKDHLHINQPKHTLGTLIVNSPGIPNERNERIRTGDPLRSKVRVVCTTCNNTWMSGIQNAAKPYLVPMLDGERRVLGEVAQRTLATWIAMATMTSEFLVHDKQQIAVSQTDREWLWRNGTPPPDWRIWIAHYRRYRSAEQWVHCSIPIYDSAEMPSLAPGDAPQCNTQCTTFVVGEMFAHVMSAKFPNHARDWDWRTWPRAHSLLTQIWPIKESIVVWPTVSMSMLDDDAINIARTFFSWVDGIGRRHGF